MKITKKDFINAMVNNASVFCGVTKRLYKSDEVYCAIVDMLQPDVILEYRRCKTLSKSLVFSGGSKLGFDQLGKYDFYKYEYPKSKIYICQHTYTDTYDNKEYCKCMYYLIKN